jgi:hypothetical protein
MHNEFNQEGQKGHKVIRVGALEERSIGLVLILPQGASFEFISSVWLGCSSNLV